MKLILTTVFLLLTIVQVSSQNSPNAHAIAKSKPYFSANFSMGQAPFNHPDFSPKVQFDYSVKNQPLTYNYLDSLHWPAHSSPFIYGGIGVEFGMIRGFYVEFNINIAANNKHTFIGGVYLAPGYNQVISKNLYLRGSLAVSWVGTSLNFNNKRVIGGDLTAFGNVYSSVQDGNQERRGTVSIDNSSLALIPRVEVNYNLPKTANEFGFASLRFGVGYRYLIRNNSSLNLEAKPDVKLNTPGLQFWDGGTSPNQIFNYKGLILNFTFAGTVYLSLHKRA